jgi:hypothetical protein
LPNQLLLAEKYSPTRIPLRFIGMRFGERIMTNTAVFINGDECDGYAPSASFTARLTFADHNRIAYQTLEEESKSLMPYLMRIIFRTIPYPIFPEEFVPKRIWFLSLFLLAQLPCHSQVLKESTKARVVNQSMTAVNAYEYSPGKMFIPYYAASDKQLHFAEYNKGASLFSASLLPSPATPLPPAGGCCSFRDPIPVAGVDDPSATLVAWNSLIYTAGGNPPNSYFNQAANLSDAIPHQFDTKFGNVSLSCLQPGLGPVCAVAWTDTNQGSIPVDSCGATFCIGNGYIHVLTTTTGNFGDASSFDRWESGNSSIWTPAVAFVGKRLYVAWIGTDGSQLINIAFSDDYKHFDKVTELSNHARQVCLAGVNGRLVLGFIGTDGQINLQVWNGPITQSPDHQYFISPSGGAADTERSYQMALSSTSELEGLLVSWQQPANTTNLAWVTLPSASKLSRATRKPLR